ncbi:MAG: helix-hairpin-helix domain-containing protein [Candidatus Bathyarchaeales archaeon]
MRSDYALYTVAIIFFILTGITLAYQVESQELWIISTFVLGLFFIGLGYSQRPRAQAKTVTVEAPLPPTPAVQEPAAVEAQAVQETVEQPTATVKGLTEVKGIGEKRAEQLKGVGINSVEDLAKASADDLAAKLKVSPKITKVWIENAKKLAEKS